MNSYRQKKPWHDLGGEKSGPVRPDQRDEPVFEKSWHKRVLGLTVAAGAMGVWSIDSSRFWRERLPKSDYQTFTYYEKWLAALTNLFVFKGLVTEEEVLKRNFDGPKQLLDSRVLRASEVPRMLASGSKTSRKSKQTPRFSIGDPVRTKKQKETLLRPFGHTRLPCYAADKFGTILFCHGNHVLPNSNAHFLGELPEPLYSVEFMATDLWPEDNLGLEDTVIVDCWESYLLSAND